jgi:hypothetical protein
MNINTPLEIQDIDFRVQSINKGGYATILAYKDARVDMNRLDAVYGVEGWQKNYQLINGNLFCSVGIWSDKLNQWVWKQDVGIESAAEKEKGQASDAFKRSCFNLGIGRELYDYPLISIQLIKDVEWKIENERPKQLFGLKLKDWVWKSEFKNDKLIFLSVYDNNNKLRFQFGEAPKTKQQISNELLISKAENLESLGKIFKSFCLQEQKRLTKFTTERKTELTIK